MPERIFSYQTEENYVAVSVPLVDSRPLGSRAVVEMVEHHINMSVPTQGYIINNEGVWFTISYTAAKELAEIFITMTQELEKRNGIRS